MKDILTPLDSIHEVSPPHFLKDKIMARIEAMEERVTPTVMALAGFALAVLFLVNVYAATQTNVKETELTSGLIQNNNLY